jgi:hypothetical protein
MSIVVRVAKKDFLAFRIGPELKAEIQKVAEGEQRSVSQICELLLRIGIENYKKEGSSYLSVSSARSHSKAKRDP